MSDRFDDFILSGWGFVTVMVGCFLAVVLVAAVATAFGGGQPDPCRHSNGKTSHYDHGWQTYGGRRVWCGK